MKKIIYGLGIVLVLFIFIRLNKPLFWTFFLLGVGSFAKFKRLKARIPIVMEPLFFFQVMITISFGVWYAVLLNVFAIIGIDMVGGDLSTFTFGAFFLQSGLNFIVLLLPQGNIIVLGLMISCLNLIGSLALAIKQNVPADRLVMTPVSRLVDLAYFTTFGSLLGTIMAL